MRAFADDIGVLAPAPRRQLRPLAVAFRAIAATTSLRLKVRKCKAIVLAPDSDAPAAARRVRDLIRATTPAWSDIEVTTSGTYLGVLVGPGASPLDQWAPAMTKLTRRAHSIAEAGLSASRGFHEYSVRAAPTIGHHAQLLAPPPGLRKLDLRLRARLAHSRFHAIPTSALMAPDHLGLRRTTPLDDLCFAAMLRSFSSTAAASWRDERSRLLRARAEGAALLALAAPHALGAALSWKSRAIVDYFHDTEASFPVRITSDATRSEIRDSGFRQASIAAALRPHDSLESCLSDLCRRVPWWARRFPEDGDAWARSPALIRATYHALVKCASVIRLAWCRALCNGLVTSARTHGGREGCVCGCPAPDGIAHCLVCDRLWTCAERVTGLRRAPTVSARLGLGSHTPAYQKRSRFAPPSASVFQLTLVCDVVSRLRADRPDARRVRSRMLDALRRHLI